MDHKETIAPTMTSLSSELDNLLSVTTQINENIQFGSLISFELTAAMQSFSANDQRLIEKLMNDLFAKQSKENQEAQLRRWKEARALKLIEIRGVLYRTPKAAAEACISSIPAGTETLHIFLGKDVAIDIKDNKLVKRPWCSFSLFANDLNNVEIMGQLVMYSSMTSGHTAAIRQLLDIPKDENRALTIEEVVRLTPPIFQLTDISFQHWVELMEEFCDLNIICCGSFNSGTRRKCDRKTLNVFKKLIK